MTRLYSDLRESVNSMLGHPFLINIALWLQENIANYIPTDSLAKPRNSPIEESPEDSEFVLLKLDHMRDKKRYVKTVVKWMLDLNLTGYLMFHGKLILIIAQGNHKNIKVQETVFWKLLME